MSHPLVASDRVEAAVVYGPDGQKIGTIERLMLEKLSGTVAYAVVKCGGVLKGTYTTIRYRGARLNTMQRAKLTRLM